MRFVRWESRREELHCLLEGCWYEPFERTKATNTYRQKSVVLASIRNAYLLADSRYLVDAILSL